MADQPTATDVQDLAERIDRLVASRRRGRWWAALMGVVVAGLVVLLVLGGLDKIGDDRTNRERRIDARAQSYGQCLDGNAAVRAQDRSLQILAASALADPTRDPERASRGLDGFRDGLALRDCESVLALLTPDEADEARDKAAQLPRIPLPPPTVPGYLPPPPPPPNGSS